jgi:hypothetical protein
VCCERLVCASCAGHVVDARCGVCAAAKAHLHGGAATLYVPEWLAALAVLLVTLVVLAAARAGG